MKLNELYAKVCEDDELKKEYLEAKNAGTLKEFLKKNACEFKAEELKKFIEAKKNGELADDELDAVSGGSDCIPVNHDDEEYNWY